MSEWKEGIWLGISALLTAMLITFAVILGGVAKEVSNMQQKDLNNTAQMQEYRKWAQYDDTIVNSADVISCIIANKSPVPAVIVNSTMSFDDPNEVFNFNVDVIKKYTWDIKKNSCYLWDGSKKNTTIYPDYTFDALNEYIPPQSIYRAHVERDLNGAVTYIWFKRVPMWSNYENVIISGSDLIACIIESRYRSVKFRLIDQSKSYDKEWDEYSLSDGFLNELKTNITSEGSYSAIIYRDSNEKIRYIEFRRI